MTFPEVALSIEVYHGIKHWLKVQLSAMTIHIGFCFYIFATTQYYCQCNSSDHLWLEISEISQLLYAKFNFTLHIATCLLKSQQCSRLPSKSKKNGPELD